MCAEIVPMCGDFYPHPSRRAERRDGQPGHPLGEGTKRRHHRHRQRGAPPPGLHQHPDAALDTARTPPASAPPRRRSRRLHEPVRPHACTGRVDAASTGTAARSTATRQTRRPRAKARDAGPVAADAQRRHDRRPGRPLGEGTNAASSTTANADTATTGCSSTPLRGRLRHAAPPAPAPPRRRPRHLHDRGQTPFMHQPRRRQPERVSGVHEWRQTPLVRGTDTGSGRGTTRKDPAFVLPAADAETLPATPPATLPPRRALRRTPVPLKPRPESPGRSCTSVDPCLHGADGAARCRPDRPHVAPHGTRDRRARRRVARPPGARRHLHARRHPCSPPRGAARGDRRRRGARRRAGHHVLPRRHGACAAARRARTRSRS